LKTDYNLAKLLPKFDSILFETLCIEEKHFAAMQAAAVCNETNDRAACYHVARQYENSGQFEQAISFFSRAQAYGNAVRLCKV